MHGQALRIAQAARRRGGKVTKIAQDLVPCDLLFLVCAGKAAIRTHIRGIGKDHIQFSVEISSGNLAHIAI
jgi:hypothetical protein